MDEFIRSFLSRSSQSGNGVTESTVFSPAFAREIPITIYHETSASSLPVRWQFEVVQQFSQYDGSIQKIKYALYDHWSTLDIDEQFYFESEEDTFEHARLLGVLVPSSLANGEIGLLLFSVDWDVEHGVKIEFRNNQIGDWVNT